MLESNPLTLFLPRTSLWSSVSSKVFRRRISISSHILTPRARSLAIQDSWRDGCWRSGQVLDESISWHAEICCKIIAYSIAVIELWVQRHWVLNSHKSRALVVVLSTLAGDCDINPLWWERSRVFGSCTQAFRSLRTPSALEKQSQLVAWILSWWKAGDVGVGSWFILGADVGGNFWRGMPFTRNGLCNISGFCHGSEKFSEPLFIPIVSTSYNVGGFVTHVVGVGGTLTGANVYDVLSIVGMSNPFSNVN